MMGVRPERRRTGSQAGQRQVRTIRDVSIARRVAKRASAGSLLAPVTRLAPAAVPVADTSGRAAPGLVLTGERTLPGIARENYWVKIN